jgi:hypothetical protein
MIDKGLQKVLTLFYFLVKKYKNIAWAPCGRASSESAVIGLNRTTFVGFGFGSSEKIPK